MLNRPPFWLGLLLGTLAAFRLRFFKPCLLKPRLLSLDLLSPDLQDLFTDAVLLCDSAGAIAYANAAAQALFGSDTLPALHYPTGQRVPPGQHPLSLASSARETVSGRYCFSSALGAVHIFDISARPLPDGGAAAIFRDITAQRESEAREQAAQAREAVVQTLCCCLSLAQTAEAMGQAVVEEVLRLLPDVPDAQIRLYLFDPAADTLSCAASAPEDRPKRPKSAAGALPVTVRFDVQVPELWQMYVARKPSSQGLPLIAGGITIGHLSVTPADAAIGPAVQETLGIVASLAALALVGPAASAQAAALTAQASVLREIAAAGSSGKAHALADAVTEAVKRVTHAEVCTVSVPVGGRLQVIGSAYQDALLFPQTASDAPCLQSKATQKAWKTQKTAMYLGLPNPSLEAGPWRSFAGSAGCHSVIALPLADKRGVLTVYTPGDKPLPDTQLKFLKTVAALASLRPAS